MLRIRHFRNLGEQELSFPPEGVAIIGRNAQGKTNLLEALYYLETFRSFRGASTEELVSFGGDGFWLQGTATDDAAGEERGISAAYQREGRRRKVVVDGSEPERIGDALGTLACVVFSPADVSIVNDGPERRRRFLDIVLSLNRPGYLSCLQRYRHVLAQRNAGLRAGQGWAALDAWTEAFAEAGAQVMMARREWVQRWAEPFGRFNAQISGGGAASLSYQPRVKPEAWDEEAVRASLREALERLRGQDERLRTTTAGPHRDEMRISLEGDEEDLALRSFGSGGQRRTAALALRLVEAATIREARGREPLVLMDDVFAELDEARSERVLELIEVEETGQVILTVPKESDVRVRRDVLPRWRIEAGRVEA